MICAVLQNLCFVGFCRCRLSSPASSCHILDISLQHMFLLGFIQVSRNTITDGGSTASHSEAKVDGRTDWILLRKLIKTFPPQCSEISQLNVQGTRRSDQLSVRVNLPSGAHTDPSRSVDISIGIGILYRYWVLVAIAPNLKL